MNKGHEMNKRGRKKSEEEIQRYNVLYTLFMIIIDHQRKHQMHSNYHHFVLNQVLVLSLVEMY